MGIDRSHVVGIAIIMCGIVWSGRIEFGRRAATMNRVLSLITNGPVLDAVWMKCRYYYAMILNNIILLSEGKHSNKNTEQIFPPQYHPPPSTRSFHRPRLAHGKVAFNYFCGRLHL